MSDDDLRAESEAEAGVLRLRIGTALAAPQDSVVLARALANSLVAVVQEYLSRTSDLDDVELFFEVHSRPADNVVSWSADILADLHRHGVPARDHQVICDNAVARAIGYVTSLSPLAWHGS